jgi:23S rRNA (guanine2445-N2)-methyltransferase / 23S rRNA (guanine2069-N7)-methyltransferase
VNPSPSTTLDLIATCAFGLESVVARELEQLGYHATPEGTGRVVFSGDYRAVCEANLWIRSADRVLIRVAKFPLPPGEAGFDELFNQTKAIAWERWIARSAAFPVAGRCVRSSITSEPAVQRTCKRAIAERLGAHYGRDLPETGPRVSIEVSLLKDVCTLTIDSSGIGLHKRGYREGTPGEAALKETLAAGLVQLSVWRPGMGRPLVDPFCGSGTIAIEAALIARSIAPGLARAQYFDATGGQAAGFDFERWRDPRDEERFLIDKDLWREIVREAKESVDPNRVEPLIHASDWSDYPLNMARRNAKSAGVDRDIQFLKRDFAQLSSKLDYGVVITNPPYGIRLGDEQQTVALYRSMPKVLRGLPTWSFHIFTGRLDIERLFGQEASKRRKLYNSTIECALFSFLGPKPPSMRNDEAFEAAPREAQAVGLAEEPSVAELEADERESQLLDGGTRDASAHGAGVTVREDADGNVVGTRASERAASASESASSDDDPSRELEPTPAPTSGRGQDVGPAFGGLRDRDEREAQEFSRCLANTFRHLRKYPARGITCYRVYERDVPDVPLIVDRYEDRFHVVEYERQHSRTGAQQADWFDRMRRAIAETAAVPIENVFMKEKHRQRGLTQHEKVAQQRVTRSVSEGEPPLKFEINLTDYVDTGLFLDHRLTRQMVREQSAGKRVLNLFCYTGSFSVYAAAGGAASTTSVDLSQTYLDWAQRNFTLNNLRGPQHQFVRSDVMEFLRDHPRVQGGSYDLVIADPPTFSNSKRTDEDWQVEDRHAEMLELLSPLMSDGGVVYFSTNYRKFKFDSHAAGLAGFAVREISNRTVPPEYRNRKVHYCWRLVKGGVAGGSSSPTTLADQ